MPNNEISASDIKSSFDSSKGDIPQELIDRIQNSLGSVESHIENKHEKELDNSEIPAILEGIEEKESEEVKEEVSDPKEVYLASLETEAERNSAKQAIEDGWDPEKYKKGGFTHREWNVRTPQFKIMDKQQKKIDNLEILLRNTLKKDPAARDKYATNLVKLHEEELKRADEDRDYDAAKQAYNKLEAAKEVQTAARKELEELDPKVSATVNEIDKGLTEDYKQALNTEAKSWISRKDIKEWFYPNSPKYDENKVKKAMEIESNLKAKNIDAFSLYNMLDIELDKLSAVKTENSKETTEKPAARKPAIESVSAVDAADFKNTSRKISDQEKTVLAALKDMQREQPGLVDKIISPKEFLKRRGYK